MPKIPPVDQYMTSSVITIGQEQSLDKAKAFMQQNKVRHLPVQSGGKLVGILSLSDLNMFAATPNSETLTVGDVMTQEPYIAPLGEPLDKVIEVMIQNKYSSVLVAHNDKVSGILTYIDALGALLDIYKTQTP